MSASRSIFRVVERVPPAIVGPWLLYQATFDGRVSTVELFIFGLSLVASTTAALALGRVRIKMDHEVEEALADLRQGAHDRDLKIAALQDAIDEKDLEAQRSGLLAAIADRHGHPYLRLANNALRDGPTV